MKKIVYLSSIILFSNLFNAQTNVFECTPQNSSITQQQLVNQNTPLIQQPCVNFESTAPYNFNSNTNKTIRAINAIDIKTDFHAKANGNNSNLHLELANKADFNVVSMNYTDLTQIKKLKKFEIGVSLPNSIQEKVTEFINGQQDSMQYINPYMVWDLKVTVELFHPDFNGPLYIDGFYNQEYEAWMHPGNPFPAKAQGQDLESRANNNYQGYYNSLGGYNLLDNPFPFLIRLAPKHLGEWTAKVKIFSSDEVYESDVFKFTVIPEYSEGYVYKLPNDRYFRLNQNSFYPSGINILWPGTQNKVLSNPGYKDIELEAILKNDADTDVLAEEYRQLKPIPRIFDNHRSLIKNVADGGGNFVRMIMHPFSQDIEWEKLGDYTERLHIAQEMDETIEYCENRGVYIDLDFQIQYVLSVDYYSISWNGSLYDQDYAYKHIPGINSRMDWFTNPTAKKYFKQKLRYVLLRWGYSTSIAMFELFSEIGDETATAEQAEIYEAWNSEMAAYVKSFYNGRLHLLQTSYAGKKHQNDATFTSPFIDVLTTNVYPGLKTYAKNWIDQIQKEYLVWYDSLLNQKKPFFMPEFNPKSETCDANQIEVKRSLWQIPFSGAAGALPWYSYENDIVYPELGKIKQFMSQINLNDGWHPGATELLNNGNWVFRNSGAKKWADDMDTYDNEADLMFLRSQDKKFAIGVITNKTLHIGNQSDCVDDFWASELDPANTPLVAPPKPPKVLEEVKVNGNNSDVKLILRGMKAGWYHIDYYHPNDLNNRISWSENTGPDVKIEFTLGQNPYDYIILFKARKASESWIDEGNEITELENKSEFYLKNERHLGQDTLTSENSKLNIELFPNPTTNKIFIELSRFDDNSYFELQNSEGKSLKQLKINDAVTELDLSSFTKGIYFLKFHLQDGEIIIKKIVKL